MCWIDLHMDGQAFVDFDPQDRFMISHADYSNIAYSIHNGTYSKT